MTMLGTLLGGRYRLDAQIGCGGMSTVYRAFDTVLERPVAIKLMHREIASDSAQLERFRREARSVARLNHPHIVTVIDAGEEPSTDSEPDDPDGTGDEIAGVGMGRPPARVGTPFIVLEYVEGETLKALIRRDGPLEIPRAIAYAIELARALGAAHERLIVHRDVKPQNVLIGVEGSAKITDFGIARTLTEEGLTMDGRVLGTTDYVSPEQALGQSVTGQSDLYSLGIVFYEMLTGTVPFPDVQLARPEVSAATAAVVDRATAKDLSQRYPDAASMVAELEEALAIEASRMGQATGEVTTVLRTLPGSARRRLPWRMRHPVRWIVSLALLAALVALALIIAANGAHRGVTPDVVAQPGLTAVPLAQTAAHDYNPFGTGPENREDDQNAVDGDPNTSWSTEHYYDGTLKKAGGTGVGLYVDAAPNVAGRQIEIQTPTPGFAVQIYVANRINLSLPYGDSTPLTARGWHGPVGADHDVRDSAHISLALGGARYRYYLIWITTLPPGMEFASISELTLFR
jgi:hypothetical protein